MFHLQWEVSQLIQELKLVDLEVEHLKGDYINTFIQEKDFTINKKLSSKYIPTYSSEIVLRIVKGPQFDAFLMVK